MSGVLEDGIKRCTEKRKSVQFVPTIHRRKTVVEESSMHYLAIYEIEIWMDYSLECVNDSLTAIPLDV